MSVPYHAKDAIVYIAPDGSAEASELLGASEWTLDMTTDTVEVTAFGDQNKQYVQGLPDISGTLSGFVKEDEDKWFKAQKSTQPVKVYLYWSRQMPSKYAYGTAWISISMSNTVTTANEIAANFVAGGPWKVQGFD